MPRDGTSGPWCANCRYALSGLAAETPCPECGGHSRATKPTGVNNRGLWILATAAACIASQAPAAVVWTVKLKSVEVLPFAIALIVIQTILVSLTLAILAARARARLTLAALLVLTVPQVLINIGASIWVLYVPPTEYTHLVYIAVPLLAIIFLPFIFILFALATTAWILFTRHRS